jgi:hypothetical protein
MNKKTFLKISIYFTVIVAVAVWSLLLWDHYHDGVPSHHLLASKDLPSFSNWWGGLLLPILTWFLLYRVQKRIFKNVNLLYDVPNYQTVVYGFLGSFLFGGMLSMFFSFGNQDLPGYMLLALLPLALLLPVYRSECLLGFVIGMTFTFGGVLPTLIGLILVIVTSILYLFVRPGILFVIARLKGSTSSKK